VFHNNSLSNVKTKMCQTMHTTQMLL